MTESPEAPWPFTDTFSPFCTAPVRSFPVAAATHLCDPTPSCSLPHPLAHHCTAASLILPGCCDAVGKGALDPTVRGHGSKVHSQTGSGALNILLSSSTPLFPSSTDACVLIGFGRVPARTGPLQYGPSDAADAASPVLCSCGSCIGAPRGRSGVPWEVVVGEAGIHQIRARRRRQQWWGPSWWSMCHLTSCSCRSPLHGMIG